MSWYGKELTRGEVRTVFTVVVKSDRPWTADELDGCIWDGLHGKESIKTDFHVKLEASWGPIKEK